MCRLDTEEDRVVFLGEGVEEPVRALHDLADTLLQFGQQPLTSDFLSLAIEHHSLEMARMRQASHSHRADEQVSLPLGEVVAGVERQTGWSDRRPPHQFRSFELRAPRRVRDRRTPVLAAVGGQRPPVVIARLDDVGFVSALHAVLGYPELTGLRMVRETDLVSVTHRIDLRQGVWAFHERIVAGSRSAVVQP